MVGLEINKIHCIDWVEGFKQLPDESVDMVICSPPYWGLRDYQLKPIVFDGDPECEHKWGEDIKRRTRGSVTESAQVGSHKNERQGREIKQGNFCLECGAWRGQLGLEPYPSMYINHLMRGFTEAKRVLKSTGSIWVNLADTYSSKPAGNPELSGLSKKPNPSESHSQRSDTSRSGVKEKSLCLIPERFALAMVESGWILRNRICWHKPNPMPSSVKDRFTNTWEYLFFFVKEKKYFFDLDAVREAHKESSIHRVESSPGTGSGMSFGINGERSAKVNRVELNPAGKNPGDFFEITTQPFPEAHFATFPEALLVKPIKVGCPQWICKKCGKIRERITEIPDFGREKSNTPYDESTTAGRLAGKRQAYRKAGIESPPGPVTKGWTDCQCGAGWEGGIVLDPFSGSGTTAKVARKYSRRYIGFELNPEYIKIANKRLAQMTLLLS